MPELDSALKQDCQRPIVTVVIPCHNHADMLGGAIDSVVMQDYRPINIVVVDDGSKDNPIEVLELKKDIDIQIVLLKNENPTGPSAARNIAIKEMWDSTDLFIMLDADDRYLQGKISKSVEKYLENPTNIGIVYTDAIIQNINTNTQIREFRQPYNRQSLEKECIISNTPLITKAALESSGGYDEEMRTCEDWDLWLRITEFFIAFHIPEALHVYTVTGKNSSDVVSQEIWNENWKKIALRISQRKNATSN